MIAFLSVDQSLEKLHTASLAIGFTRAFRVVRHFVKTWSIMRMPCFRYTPWPVAFVWQVWQSSEDALLQMVLVVIIRFAGGQRAAHWHELGTAVQLILVSHNEDPTYNRNLIYPMLTIMCVLFILSPTGRSLWSSVVCLSLCVNWILLFRSWSHLGRRVNSGVSPQALCWPLTLHCAHCCWQWWSSLPFSLPLSSLSSHYLSSWWGSPGHCALGQVPRALPAPAQILYITSSSAKDWRLLSDQHLLMAHLVSETK